MGKQHKHTPFLWSYTGSGLESDPSKKYFMSRLSLHHDLLRIPQTGGWFQLSTTLQSLLFVLLVLSTSPWCLSGLWGGGVPTLDINQCVPRICHLLLRTLINPSWPLLLPSYFPSPPLSSPSCLCTVSSNHPSITCLCPSNCYPYKWVCSWERCDGFIKIYVVQNIPSQILDGLT